MTYVAAAGPIANLVVAVAFAIASRVLDLMGVGGFAYAVFVNVVYINVLLAIFNLIPIPPLDGYNVVLAYLPPRQAVTIQQYAPYGMIALLLLIFLPGSPLRALLSLAAPVTQVLIGA